MSQKQQPIACQQIFRDSARLFPKKHAAVIAQNTDGISPARIHRVFRGSVNDPVKVIEVARAAVKTIRKMIDPDYAKGRKIVIATTMKAKPKS